MELIERLMPSSTDVTRRTVVRTIGAGGAAALGAGGAGAAAATESNLSHLRVRPDCTCTTEFRCNTNQLCNALSDPKVCEESWQQEYRECCTCDDGTVCDDWADYGQVCCGDVPDHCD